MLDDEVVPSWTSACLGFCAGLHLTGFLFVCFLLRYIMYCPCAQSLYLYTSYSECARSAHVHKTDIHVLQTPLACGEWEAFPGKLVLAVVGSRINEPFIIYGRRGGNTTLL